MCIVYVPVHMCLMSVWVCLGGEGGDVCVCVFVYVSVCVCVCCPHH